MLKVKDCKTISKNVEIIKTDYFITLNQRVVGSIPTRPMCLNNKDKITFSLMQKSLQKFICVETVSKVE